MYIKIIRLVFLDYVGVILPFMIMIGVSRKLSVDNFSDFLFLNVLYLFFCQIIDYSYVVKASAYTKYKSLRLFSEIQSARLLLMSVCFSFCVLIIFSTFNAHVRIHYLFFVIVMTLSNFVGTQWFFSSQAKNHIFSAFNNVGKFLLFIFSVFLLEDNDNFYMFLYVGAFVNCLVMYFCYIWTFNKSKIKFFKVKIREGYLNLLKNRDVFLADFSPQIYITVPLLISKQFWDHYSYSSLVVALRFYNAGMVVQWSMLRAVLPIQKKYSELLFAKAVKASAFVCFSQYLSIVLLAYPVLDFMFDYPIHDIYRNTVIISFSYFASHYYITYGYHYRVLNRTTDVLKKDSMKVSFFSVFITPVAIYYFGVFGYMFCFVFLKSLYGFICFKRFKTEREGD